MEPPSKTGVRCDDLSLAGQEQTYVLRLYVTGLTSASQRAIRSLKAQCEQYLRGQFQLEIIDIFQRPELAKGEHITAIPTLVRLRPLPVQRLIGDLSGLNGRLFRFDE